MNTTNATTLQQLGGIGPIAAMTGATIVYDDSANSVTLVFKRQVGTAKKLTHLKVTYNATWDLYDLAAYKLNKRTGACPQVWELGQVYADDLKRICEETTGLYFTL